MSFIKSTNVITDTALTVSNLTGGTNGKVVRISGANTATDAANTDTSTQLNATLLKSGGVYYAAGVVPGFSGLSPGSPCFLAGDGTPTATPPTPSTSVRVLFLGFAINSSDLLFRPGTPISGT